MYVGDLIKKVRLEKGLTQEEFEFEFGMQARSLRAYERPTKANNEDCGIRLETAEQLAYDLNVSLLDLLQREP